MVKARKLQVVQDFASISMQKPESKIERKACELVKQHLGIIGSKLVVPGDTGFPDRIFWIPGGKPLLIEFKRPGEEPKPKQLHNHQQLRKLGYRVEVHDNELRALQAVIDAVETTQLPKEGREILARARSICALLRPRVGQDIDHISSHQDVKKEKAPKQGATHRPIKGVLQRVAKRNRKMD